MGKRETVYADKGKEEKVKFNWENRNEIDNIYIHDSIFKGYSYDYDKREIELYCEYKYAEEKTDEMKFIFHNVFMTQLQSCSLWGNGLHVLGVYYDPDSFLLREAKQMIEEAKNKWGGQTYLDEKMEYLPIVFEMNSGDVLMIACEEFEYEVYEKV